MAITYFPRLNAAHASAVITSLNGMSIEIASEKAASRHDNSFDYATAQQKVDSEALDTLRESVISVARECGFPAKPNKKAAIRFDKTVSKILDEELDMIPAEAANSEVWNFLTLVLLPDVAMWRYPNEKNNPAFERWMGEPRNVFRKLWWRAATLGHELNEQLGEDEAVQIMERTNLAANPAVARAMARALVQVRNKYPSFKSSNMMRACALQVSVLYSTTTFELFSEEQLDEVILDVFERATKAYVDRVKLTRAAK